MLFKLSLFVFKALPAHWGPAANTYKIVTSSHGFVLQSDWYRQIQAPEVDNFSHECYQALSSRHFEERAWDQGYSLVAIALNMTIVAKILVPCVTTILERFQCNACLLAGRIYCETKSATWLVRSWNTLGEFNGGPLVIMHACVEDILWWNQECHMIGSFLLVTFGSQGSTFGGFQSSQLSLNRKCL